MRVARGSEHHTVTAGHLVVWDPGAAHRGWSADGSAWDARLLVISNDDLRALVADQDGASTLDARHDPVLEDAVLAQRFRLLYDALAVRSDRLEADVLLSDWLDSLLSRRAPFRTRQPDAGRTRSRSEVQAVERACDVLRTAPARRI